VQYFIVLFTMDYFVRNNMKGKICFSDSEGGGRDPCPPLNTPLTANVT